MGLIVVGTFMLLPTLIWFIHHVLHHGGQQTVLTGFYGRIIGIGLVSGIIGFGMIQLAMWLHGQGH